MEDPSLIPDGTGFLVCLEDFGIVFFKIDLICLCVCFVALCPKSTMVMAGRSVHLTTLFPGQA